MVGEGFSFGLSYSAASDLSTKQGLAVQQTGDTACDVADATHPAVGILLNAPRINEPADVCEGGYCEAVIDGNSVNVTYNDPLKVSATGTLVKSATDHDDVIARARCAVTADGIKGTVLVARYDRSK